MSKSVKLIANAAITGIKKKTRIEPRAGERNKNAADLKELNFLEFLLFSIESSFE
jgi:hypothetical protein